MKRKLVVNFKNDMKKPRIIQFLIEQAEEGGYTAKALLFPIFTQGETLDEIVKNIREAVECHFNNENGSIPVIVNYELPIMA